MSFSSFNALLPALPRLAACLPNAASYWGHTPGAAAPTGKLPELLQEHIDRVNATCLGLVRAHGLEPIIDGLIAGLLPVVRADDPTWAGNFIKTGFLAAVAFHDFGKVNENYQRHLGNTGAGGPVSNGIGSEHSGLGACMWLHYALHQLDAAGLNDVALDKLVTLTLDFADLILNHHSSTLFRRDIDPEKYRKLEGYLTHLKLPVVADALDVAAQKADYHQDFYTSGKGPVADGFARFALLKLCFSLLTASDYLATLAYMQTGGDYTRLDAAALGILSTEDKALLSTRFRAFDYNRDALADPDRYADLPWEQVQKRSKANLNALRQKLLAEVVRTVRRQPTAPLYYLEAPTGAGKTNLSLAVGLELLAHDARLGKVFYVFPFTTLITQTYDDIKTKLGLTDAQIVQLHSKAEHSAKPPADGAEGTYGAQWHNHVDTLFVQYPITLLSHVRFFDVLKSNRKEANYLLHRLANSVVVLDEIQSYSPVLWDHVNYFLLHYARQFNIRVVVMSATLPKLYQLTREAEAPAVVPLVADASRYFRNPNFAGRISFDFSLLDKDWRQRYADKDADEGPAVLAELADAVAERCEAFAVDNEDRVAAIVEFITKKSAAGFSAAARAHPVLAGYEIRMLSGSILEPRRREVVRWLKAPETRGEHPRILLICTQVVEAGVDIDMDVGFKDRSLLDSDEQLAGRVNRNATRPAAPVYLFDLDLEAGIYGADLRLRVARVLEPADYQRILREKDFNFLYQQVIAALNKKAGQLNDRFGGYQELVRQLEYADVDHKFQLIEDGTESVFIPLVLPTELFTDSEQVLLRAGGVLAAGTDVVDGEAVFAWYLDTIRNKSGDFIRDREARQRLQSVMSKFTISVYPQLAQQMRTVATPKPHWHDYGFVYLNEPEGYYSYEEGLLPTVNFATGDIW